MEHAIYRVSQRKAYRIEFAEGQFRKTASFYCRHSKLWAKELLRLQALSIQLAHTFADNKYNSLRLTISTILLVRWK